MSIVRISLSEFIGAKAKLSKVWNSKVQVKACAMWREACLENGAWLNPADFNAKHAPRGGPGSLDGD